MAGLQRPANSIISGAMHIDRDEFQLPTGAYIDNSFSKTTTVVGAVDELAYSGPPSTSTLANFEDLLAQLRRAGYTPVFTCIRKACGGYHFGAALAQPLIDSIHNEYGGLTVDALSAPGDDVRYAALRRGGEYLGLLTTLNPGTHSGVLLIHVSSATRAE